MSNNIADRYAQVKMQIEALEEELKGIKALADATGLEVIDGDTFRLSIKPSSRTSLDKDILAQWLTEEQMQEATKTSTFLRYTYKAIMKKVA
jgi:hypothetical protein